MHVYQHSTGKDWEIWDATMLLLHKSQRRSLASVACALACMAINAAHAEVASIYGGSDGRLWKSHRKRRTCELFGLDCGTPQLAIWVAGDRMSPRMCCRAD